MNQQNFLIPVLLIALFYLIHLFYIRKQNRTRNLKNQQDILRSQIDIQEQTFQKISADIHDNISLTLSLSKIYLHDLDFNDRGDLSDKINMSICLIKKAIGDLNDLSKSLNPHTVEQFGLIKSIEEQVGNIRKTDMFSIKFTVKGIPCSPGMNGELIIFRIIQEALNNIIRHANATEVNVVLEYQKSGLAVKVRDNGYGFSTENSHDNNGSGLSNMKKRAQMINAHLVIDSKLYNGTTIKLQIPFNN